MPASPRYTSGRSMSSCVIVIHGKLFHFTFISFCGRPPTLPLPHPLSSHRPPLSIFPLNAPRPCIPIPIVRLLHPLLFCPSPRRQRFTLLRRTRLFDEILARCEPRGNPAPRGPWFAGWIHIHLSLTRVRIRSINQGQGARG